MTSTRYEKKRERKKRKKKRKAISGQNHVKPPYTRHLEKEKMLRQIK
jgi:hypothetical protein